LLGDLTYTAVQAQRNENTCFMCETEVESTLDECISDALPNFVNLVIDLMHMERQLTLEESIAACFSFPTNPPPHGWSTDRIIDVCVYRI